MEQTVVQSLFSLTFLQMGDCQSIVMDIIEELWERLNLTEEEDVAINIGDDKLGGVQRKGNLCFIGKIWIDRSIGRSIIESAMVKI